MMCLCVSMAVHCTLEYLLFVTRLFVICCWYMIKHWCYSTIQHLLLNGGITAHCASLNHMYIVTFAWHSSEPWLKLMTCISSKPWVSCHCCGCHVYPTLYTIYGVKMGEGSVHLHDAWRQNVQLSSTCQPWSSIKQHTFFSLSLVTILSSSSPVVVFVEQFDVTHV